MCSVIGHRGSGEMGYWGRDSEWRGGRWCWRGSGLIITCICNETSQQNKSKVLYIATAIPTVDRPITSKEGKGRAYN